MNITTLDCAVLVHAVFERPTLVLSDAHTSSRGRHNNCQEDLLRGFLSDYGPARWDLVLLGDWRDYIEEPRARAHRRHNDWLERRIALHRTVELLGNHENIPGLAADAYVLDTGSVFAWHGDALDPACSGAGRLDVFGSGVWSVLERVGLGSALGGIKRRIVDRLRPTASIRDDGNAVYLADAMNRGKVLYLCGHTHRPQLVEWGPGHIFVNCGSWVEPGKGYAVTVDGRNVRLLEVSL